MSRHLIRCRREISRRASALDTSLKVSAELSTVDKFLLDLCVCRLAAVLDQVGLNSGVVGSAAEASRSSWLTAQEGLLAKQAAAADAAHRGDERSLKTLQTERAEMNRERNNSLSNRQVKTAKFREDHPYKKGNGKGKSKATWGRQRQILRRSSPS